MKFARMNNILLDVALAVTLFASANLPGSVLAAGTAVVSVSAPTQAVSSGTQFTVNITVQPNNAIAGAQFNLSFNPALVSVISVNEGNLLNQNGASTYFMPGTINNTAGTVTGVAGAITAPGKTVSTTGTFAVITMTAGTPKGTSILTLSNVIVGDINGQSVNVNVVNGQVVINGETTTTPPAPTGGGGGSGGGGGGGGGPRAPTSVAGVIDLTSIIDARGIFSLDVNAWSDDKKVVMLVGSGTTGINSSGTALTQISIIHISTPPTLPTDAGIVTLAYDFQPSGATFNPPATVRFNYDPTLIPADVTETNLQIAYYDSTTSTWITLPSSVDTSNKFINAQIAHFTTYAVTYGVLATTSLSTATPPAPTLTPTPAPIRTAILTNIPIETTTPISVETAATPKPAELTATLESPTTTNNPSPTNTLVVRMAILASAIFIAAFLISAITTIIWLRHRDILKKGGHLS